MAEIDKLLQALHAQSVSLDDLERAKVAAGRPKDIPDLEVIRELKRGP